MAAFSDYVIIGGVACGPKTAATLARRQPDASITVFQREKFISYGSCGMPYFASGDIGSFEELTMTGYGVPRTPEFFKQSKGFDVHTECEVVAINREDKTVEVRRLADDTTFTHGYGKLIIATGANPIPPPFPCDAATNIRSFTRPQDALAFRKLAETGQVGSVVIVGGGFIGCELAEAAATLWGLEVTLVEAQDRVLPYVLDRDMAHLVEREMIKQEVTVHCGRRVEKIEAGEDGAVTVALDGNETVSADFVFLCLGVTPEVSLAKSCGLDIGSAGGIKVNNHMQTSDPDIYAGGDCVELHNLISDGPVFMPMGSLANRHGRVIAENLVGNQATFDGVTGAFLVKVFDLNVGAVGLSEAGAQRSGIPSDAVWGSFPDKPDYYPESKSMSLKMIFNPENNKLLGLQATGDGDICRRIDIMSLLLQRGSTVDDIFAFEQGYAPPYSEAMDPLHHLASLAQSRPRGIAFVPADINDPRLAAMASDKTVWLDVREPDEVESKPVPAGDGRLAGTVVTIPLQDLRSRIGDLNKDARTVVVCRRGPRAYQATLILRQAGFTDVHIMGGGTRAAGW